LGDGISLSYIAAYIEQNPQNWEKDEMNILNFKNKNK
jgi:hypothetical protein